MNSNLDGMSNIPCASIDKIPAVLRWILLDNDKGILFIIRMERKGTFSTIVIHDNPIFALLHYNLENINLI